jgi:hypothetical protein
MITTCDEAHAEDTRMLEDPMDELPQLPDTVCAVGNDVGAAVVGFAVGLNVVGEGVGGKDVGAAVGSDHKQLH